MSGLNMKSGNCLYSFWLILFGVKISFKGNNLLESYLNNIFFLDFYGRKNS